MRREITGILVFFFVILTLISLLSYSPADPSINTARSAGHIHNFFGLFGAHLAGILIGLFGLGSFWIPILLLLVSIHFFGDHPNKEIIPTIIGGIILMITTGGLLAIKHNHIIIFGSKFSSGGIIGIPLKSFFVKYSNVMGGAIILALLWIIGLILATGFSLIRFGKRLWQTALFSLDRLKTLIVKWKEQRKKLKQRLKTIKEKTPRAKPKITIKSPDPQPIKQVPVPRQEVFDFMRKGSGFQLPSINLLDNFVITTFEYEPAPGVKINKIVNLTDDLALALRATSIRIVAPIPGKAVIGIELPNAIREVVRFKGIVGSSDFEKSKSKLTICLGKDIIGNPVVAELDRMPHLLIAGATGSGKSVALNAMICSLLFKSTPDEVKLIMIDPKRIELSSYDGIPHLITPVVTDVKKATNALFWAVREMEKRYELLSEKKSRHIRQYNQKIEKETKTDDGPESEKLPYIVIVIDELADLMLVASRNVEIALTRLAQMARAAGIHLILATQRPSVDVLTGIIKANFPTRLTFQVSSKTDSRTIIDTNGAENLLGNGDMLFLPPGAAKLQRIHGAFISEDEHSRIIEFLKKQKSPEYDKSILDAPPKEEDESDTKEYDERYDDALALVTKTGQASISMIQRHLRIGYNRAARIIEVMEKEGVVGPSDGAKPREVLVKGYEDIP
ncbi:MAG: DNA translocase FtsK [Desulfobacterales bacterium]